MYYAEGPSQPEKFSSIPATMWYSVVTLTTVGYGDVSPKTPIGKLLGSIIALLGIGMFALPTGIISAGFMDEMKRRRVSESVRESRCPHCGEPIR